MPLTQATPDRTEETLVAAATAGDEAAFNALVQRYRRELHVHCYRMLGSYDEAEDLVQDSLLRAWRNRDSFDGGPGYRAWLYRIATNACLDALRKKKRQLTSLGSFAEVPWLQPYPDRQLDEIAPPEAEPDAVVVARETIELAFLATMQLLPLKQRAVLILRDVLGWSAGEAAVLLETSVAATNSALQRARATLQEKLPPRRADWSAATLTEQGHALAKDEQELLARFIQAHERGDIEATVAMVREDIRITMPPHPYCFDGIEALRTGLESAFGPDSLGAWRLVPARANRQPAAASYLRAKNDSEFRAFKIDVLRVEDGAIAEITTFNADLFPAFGLPVTL